MLWISEPKETRLGYAQNRVDGNSIGNGLIPDFIEAIEKNKAVASGIVYRFSDLELFVKNVSCDRISDITTKILKVILISFTQGQCKKHGIPMSGVLQTDLFDIADKSWKQREVELPEHEGSPIIFVPKFTVRRKSDAGSSMGAFIRFAENEFVLKDSSEIIDLPKNGRKNTVLKKDLRKALRDKQNDNPQKGYRKVELSRWVSKYSSLLDDFNDFQSRSHKIVPLTDEEISAVIYS